jgi:hypothetical protein
VQRDTITHQPDSTIHVAAALGIIDPIAVANIKPVLAAVFPDGVLNEPGEGLRKRRIELPGISPVGSPASDPWLWQGEPILHNMLVWS